MAFSPMLWALIYMSISTLLLQLLWALYGVIAKRHSLTRNNASLTLGIYFICYQFAFMLGEFLQFLGVCHKYKLARFLLKGIPPRSTSKLNIKDFVFNGLLVRMYFPKMKSPGNRRGLLYIHGGVGLLGSIQAYERVCRYLARESDTIVVCVGYRQAPEHPFPVQYQDCITAAVYFLQNAKEYGVDPSRISIAGDSSGGTIATAVCQILTTRKDLPRFQAQILLYPFLQGVDLSLPSHQQNCLTLPLTVNQGIQLIMGYINEKTKDVDEIMKNAHVPKNLRMRYKKWISAENIPEEFKVRGYVSVPSAPFSDKLHKKCKLVFDPMFSPLLAEDAIIRQLPKTFIFTCEYDFLRDDGLLYKKRLEDNGVPVTWFHDKNGFHGNLFLIDCWPLELSDMQTNAQQVIWFIKQL